MMHGKSGPDADTINPKHFTRAKPHTYQGNLWQLHPAIVTRLVPLPNFVNWRWELNEKGDAWTKVPYQPRDPAKKAATDNKKTWGTYAEAVDNVVAGKADGIGFCLFETNICAFDVDDCCDLVTGRIDRVALELIKRCGATYVEKTVSGTGLRIIGLGGTKYVNRKQKIDGSKVSIESYRYCARYITISGMTLDGVKPNMPDLGNIDAQITSVVEELDHQTDANSTKADNTTNTPSDGEAKTDTFTDDPLRLRTEASLPPDLASLIRDGVPITEDRSAAFYHAVKWLKDRGWSLDGIIGLLARYPNGISAKYGSRFAGEAARAFGKPEKDKTGTAGAGQGPTGPVASPIVIKETLEVFDRWLALPDQTPILAALGTVAANLLPGDPVWLGLIGPPSSAKTEILNSTASLSNVAQAATMTVAGLLSGSPKKSHAKGAQGGLLRQIGAFGIIVLKDFGSILSMHPETKAEVLAALREIYDGAWTRHLGSDGGRTLSWQGKVGMLFAATGVIDSHYAVIGSMGDRFLLSRLAPVGRGQFGRAMKHVGTGTKQMREELSQTVTRLFAGLKAEPCAITEEEIERIDDTIMLVVRLRGAVARDRQSREIEAVYGAEGTARIGLTLERLLAGLDTLGVDRATAMDVVVSVALDSVPPARRKAYDHLHALNGVAADTTTIAKAMVLPTVMVRRVLEELVAYGLASRESQGQGKPDLWRWMRF